VFPTDKGRNGFPASVGSRGHLVNSKCASSSSQLSFQQCFLQRVERRQRQDAPGDCVILVQAARRRPDLLLVRRQWAVSNYFFSAVCFLAGPVSPGRASQSTPRPRRCGRARFGRRDSVCLRWQYNACLYPVPRETELKQADDTRKVDTDTDRCLDHHGDIRVLLTGARL
jgi:hypothetical protein